MPLLQLLVDVSRNVELNDDHENLADEERNHKYNEQREASEHAISILIATFIHAHAEKDWWERD